MAVITEKMDTALDKIADICSIHGLQGVGSLRHQEKMRHKTMATFITDSKANLLIVRARGTELWWNEWVRTSKYRTIFRKEITRISQEDCVGGGLTETQERL
eukprot:3828042-Rhodomonas_salina.1